MLPPIGRPIAAIAAALILTVAAVSPAEAKRRGHRGPSVSAGAFLGSLFGGLRSAPPRRAMAARRPVPSAGDVRRPVAEAAPPQRQALAEPPPQLARSGAPATAPATALGATSRAGAPGGGGWIEPVR